MLGAGASGADASLLGHTDPEGGGDRDRRSRSGLCGRLGPTALAACALLALGGTLHGWFGGSLLRAPDADDEPTSPCEWDSYRLPFNALPVHYDLTIEMWALTPPVDVLGRMSILVARNESMAPPKCLVLHVDPSVVIHSMEMAHQGQRFEPVSELDYDGSWKQLTIKLNKPLETNGTLRLSFSYPLEDKLTGLYHSRYMGPEGQWHSIATTQHEATSARETFPCWDEPGFKATFAITLHIPDEDDGLLGLSNMPALSEAPIEANETLATLDELRDVNVTVGPRLRRLRFDTSPRMSTYLVAFVVGRLEAISTTTESGVLLSAWAPAATSGVDKLHFALDIAREALQHYEEIFALPFPLAKIDIVSIPDFGPGAMENWGLITYRATNVLADDFSSPSERQSVAATVVHELGHQWFGNLVTMKWWNELWLNEGFANYFEQAVTQFVQPDLQVIKQHVTYLSRALKVDGSPDTHAVRMVVRITSDSAVSSLFDAISYDKAGAVIYMLHDYLERAQRGCFYEGLRGYLAHHQYGTAGGAQLWKHVGDACHRPVADWVDPWFGQAGYPLIEVTSLSDGSAVLMQTGRFVQDLTSDQIAFGGKAGGLTTADWPSWFVPLTYITSNNEQVRTGEIESTSTFFSVPPTRKHLGGFDPEGVDWLKVNINGAGYYRVNYPPHLWARLAEAAEIPDRLSDADLANLIDDAFALTLDGRLSHVTLRLSRALGVRTAHESTPVSAAYESWRAVSQGLYLFLSLITDAAERGRFESITGELVGVPPRCPAELRRFVRAQVIGRALDQLLSAPPSGPTHHHFRPAHKHVRGANRKYPHLNGRHAPAAEVEDEADDAAAEQVTAHRSQLEELTPPVLLALASAMQDSRVGVWAYKALSPCLSAPEDECAAIGQISADLRGVVLELCTAFDRSGKCWRLVLAQLRRATDPAYRVSLMAALARAPTDELLNSTLGLVLDPSLIRPQDCTSMIAALAGSVFVPGARNKVWEFAKRNVATLSLSGGGGGAYGFGSVLQNVAGGFASETMAQDVQLFVAMNSHLSVPARIVRAVTGKIRTQGMWVEYYGADTCETLEAYS